MSPDTPWAARSRELSPVPSSHAVTVSSPLQRCPLGYSFFFFLFFKCLCIDLAVQAFWGIQDLCQLCHVGFSRPECWSGLPSPSPGDLPDPGIKPLQADFFTDRATREALIP